MRAFEVIFLKWLLAASLTVVLVLAMACTKEVIREVVVTPVPGPTGTAAPGDTEAGAAEGSGEVVVTSSPEPATTTASTVQRGGETATPPTGTDGEDEVYLIGIAEDLTTTNYWAYLGPDGTIWNSYVLGGSKPALYGYSAQRYDWVPSLAADFPTPLAEETVGGETFWTTEVRLKQGVKWSDGTDVTAEDFAFTANTAVEMELTGNWPSIVDPEYFDHAEAVSAHDLKIYFKQKPGLARWQFGLAFMPIFAKGYWEPVVSEANQAGDLTEQHKVLYAHVPDGEPSAGGFIFDQWERGAYVGKNTNPDYYFAGAEVGAVCQRGVHDVQAGGIRICRLWRAYRRTDLGIYRRSILPGHDLFRIRQPGRCRTGVKEG